MHFFNVQNALRRFIFPLYRNLESSVHPLRYLFIEITQRCNLNCLHCGSDCSKDMQYEELSTEEWLAFFKYLAENFDRRSLVLVVTGGEPLCCPSFEKIIAGIKDNGLAWGMVTNGFSLTKNNFNKVLQNSITSITISLDGLRESHDWLRGKNGSFEHAVQAIRLAVAAKLPFFDIVTCVNPRNLHELPKIEELLRNLGVPAWRLFSIFPKGRAKENRELILSDGEMKKLFQWINMRRSVLKNSNFSIQFSCEGYLPAKVDRSVRGEPYFCRAGINIGSVLCDGSISACPNITRKLIQGNIRKDDFKEIWEEKFHPFRERSWMKQEACRSCKEWKKCLGNSLHLWDDELNKTSRCFLDISNEILTTDIAEETNSI